MTSSGLVPPMQMESDSPTTFDCYSQPTPEFPPYSPPPLESEDCFSPPPPEFPCELLESEERYEPKTICISPQPSGFPSELLKFACAPPYIPRPLESETDAPPTTNSPPQPLECSPQQPLESDTYATPFGSACSLSRLEYESHLPPFKPSSKTYYDDLLFDLGRTLHRDPNKSPKSYGERGLVAAIGLHCYNFHKGTNLQFLGFTNYYRTGIFSWIILFEAEDTMCKSIRKFETDVCYILGPKSDMEISVTRCILEPDVEQSCYEELPEDVLFKGEMPNWLPEFTDSDELLYYELEESEVQENKEWLHLYAELAVYAKLRYYLCEPYPLDLGKIIVRTRQDVESKKNVKARNAIFYISFKSSGGQDYNAIVRRTTTAKPHHMKLEVECLT